MIRTMASIWIAAAVAAGAQESAEMAPRPACAAPEHRQFDFWVGEWDVHRTRTGARVARSVIERLHEGCTIRENWMPLEGGGGGSLNSWLPRSGVWRQIWVDSMNSWAVFEGGIADGAMRLQGVWPGAAGPGTEPLVRIAWTQEEAGAVRQFGEISHDDGASWLPFFDLTCRPAGAQGGAEAD